MFAVLFIAIAVPAMAEDYDMEGAVNNLSASRRESLLARMAKMNDRIAQLRIGRVGCTETYGQPSGSYAQPVSTEPYEVDIDGVRVNEQQLHDHKRAPDGHEEYDHQAKRVEITPKMMRAALRSNSSIIAVADAEAYAVADYRVIEDGTAIEHEGVRYGREEIIIDRCNNCGAEIPHIRGDRDCFRPFQYERCPFVRHHRIGARCRPPSLGEKLLLSFVHGGLGGIAIGALTRPSRVNVTAQGGNATATAVSSAVVNNGAASNSNTGAPVVAGGGATGVIATGGSNTNAPGPVLGR